jgi:Family of unknown function (DUF6527)
MTVRSEMVNGCLVWRVGGPLPVKVSDGKLRIRNSGGGTFSFECPGCEETHTYRTDKTQEPCWEFNGSASFPTFYPSMIIACGSEHVCHFFVTDGQIAFVSDSTHELAGKTVNLPEVGA